MSDDDSTSFAHTRIISDRAIFEGRFEQFLVSLETPVEARREVAAETVNRLNAIVNRLRAQGVL